MTTEVLPEAKVWTHMRKYAQPVRPTIPAPLVDGRRLVLYKRKKMLSNKHKVMINHI